jgi:U3 small nucleolar RNA-associated protein 21
MLMMMMTAVGAGRKRPAERDAVAEQEGAEVVTPTPDHPPAPGHPLLFSPFRTIGHVTADVPLCIQAQGQAFFLTSSIGRAFHIYGVERMNLLFVSSPPPTSRSSHAIAALTAWKEWTFAATGAEVLVYQRAKPVASMALPADLAGSAAAEEASIFALESFGDTLVSAHANHSLGIWNCRRHAFLDLISAAELEHGSGRPFHPSTLLHPSTYVNKVLVGSHQGTMQLWNVQSHALVFDFGPGFGSPITVLASSPCIDVVAVGLLDGSILLHNLKANVCLMRLQQEGPVTALSFRTDGESVLVSASSHGDICLWDLEERRLAHMMSNAHDASIHTCSFLHGQPILVTASADNSIKQWIFDNADGVARLLKLRSGHHQAPSKIAYYGEEGGSTLLSAAQDQSLRSFSTTRDSRNVELSQGAVERKASRLAVHVDSMKLPPIAGFAANAAKERQWDNVLSCHVGERFAKTWSTQRKAIGKHTFPARDGSVVRCVGLSACGNFGLLGCASGRVDMYNMQSGAFRRTFGVGEGEAHGKAVTGLATDATSRTLFTASLDGSVKVRWPSAFSPSSVSGVVLA